MCAIVAEIMNGKSMTEQGNTTCPLPFSGGGITPVRWNS
jgi:hypothetical protein